MYKSSKKFLEELGRQAKTLTLCLCLYKTQADSLSFY